MLRFPDLGFIYALVVMHLEVRERQMSAYLLAHTIVAPSCSLYNLFNILGVKKFTITDQGVETNNVGKI